MIQPSGYELQLVLIIPTGFARLKNLSWWKLYISSASCSTFCMPKNS